MTTLLVIEDRIDLRGELVDLLTVEGYEVFSAEDGVSGLETAIRTLPDLILSNIMLPRLTGYNLSLKLQAVPATADIPVILMISRSSLCEALPDNYIHMPFTADDLLQFIQTQLAKKAAQEQARQAEIDELEPVQA